MTKIKCKEHWSDTWKSPGPQCSRKLYQRRLNRFGIFSMRVQMLEKINFKK